MTAEGSELQAIEALLRAAVAERPGCEFVSKVMVLAETTSTQDAARRMCDGRGGLVVCAGMQTAGRGRLGRRWMDDRGQGLAITFAMDASRIDLGHVSLALGLAACETCEVVTGQCGARFGLRWPNDVVVADGPLLGRKVAGVLIEQSASLLLAGVGVNVQQSVDSFPATLAGRASSLRMLGVETTRGEVAATLVRTLRAALDRKPDEVVRAWSTRCVLRGRTMTFIHNGERFTGLVRGLHPTSHIDLELADGSTLRLPALTTSLEPA